VALNGAGERVVAVVVPLEGAIVRGGAAVVAVA
jgi:hypothetical protein